MSPEGVADATGGDDVATDAGAPAADSAAMCAPDASGECNQCANANCCSEVLACKNSPDCVSLQSCLAKCEGDTDGGEACQLACATEYPDGTGDFFASQNCKIASCATPCKAGSTPVSACGAPGLSAACTSCIVSNCCAETFECDLEPACAKIFNCDLNCSGSQSCLSSCEDGGSQSTLQTDVNMLNCWLGACSAPCNFH